MPKNRKPIFILFFFICNLIYNQKSFALYTKKTFKYGNNLNFKNQQEDIFADLYYPLQIKNTKIPVVILLHGGGFIAGTKNIDVVQKLADKITQNGMACMSIDTRQGYEETIFGETTFDCASITKDNMYDMLHRTVQDVRAIVRYTKANGAINGIDTNAIFLAGISSGAYAMLSYYYYDDYMIPKERLQKLGSIHNQSNTLQNTENVNGIISIAGDFFYKNVNPNIQTPLLFFHGTCDNTVSIKEYYMASCSNLPISYGPIIYLPLLEQNNILYNAQIFCGYNHGFLTKAQFTSTPEIMLNYFVNKTKTFINGIRNNNAIYGVFVANDFVNAQPIDDNCINFESFQFCKKDSVKVEEGYFGFSPNPMDCYFKPKIEIKYSTNEVFDLIILNQMGKIIHSSKINHIATNNIIYVEPKIFGIGFNLLLLKTQNGKTIYKEKIMKYCNN